MIMLLFFYVYYKFVICIKITQVTTYYFFLLYINLFQITQNMAGRITFHPSELTCSICLVVFTDPRTLPCIHSFCFGCLNGQLRKSAGKHIIYRSLSKESSPVPPNGPKEVKINNFLQDLVGRFNKNELITSDGQNVCSTDDCVQPSLQYCTEGWGHLCNDCFRQDQNESSTTAWFP